MTTQQYRQLPKCEFFLNTISYVTKHDDSLEISDKKLWSITYLIEKQLNKSNITLGYDFDEFLVSGPYDSKLINDLKAWKFLGFIKEKDPSSYPFTNIRLNDDRAKGDIYKSDEVENILEKVMGKSMLNDIRTKFTEYLKKESLSILIEDTYKQWIKDHKRNDFLEELIQYEQKIKS